MKAPLTIPSNLERLLKDNELESMNATKHCRAFASSYIGVDMKSEVASQDREWGYIFRYDVFNIVTNESDTHPVFKDMKEKVLVVTKLFVISSNGINVTRSITIPMPERTKTL
jgi:hypothetical protein